MDVRAAVILGLVFALSFPVQLFAGYDKSSDEALHTLAEISGLEESTLKQRLSYRQNLRDWMTDFVGKPADRIKESYLPLLESPDPLLRDFACRFADLTKDKRATASLLKMLSEDPAEDLRAEAARTLAGFGAKEALPILKQILEKEGEEGIRAAAFDAAATLEADWLMPVARKLLKAKPSDSLKSTILLGVASAGDADSVDFLRELAYPESGLGDDRQRVSEYLGFKIVGEDPVLAAKAKAAYGELFARLPKEDRFWLLYWFTRLEPKDRDASAFKDPLEKMLEEPVGKEGQATFDALSDAGYVAQIFHTWGLPTDKAISRMADLTERVSRGFGGNHMHEMENYENIYSQLPDAVKGALDKERRRRLRQRTIERARKTPACATLCDLVHRAPDWAQERYYLHPEGPESQTVGWEFAIRSLGVLFLAKAAPYCPEAKQKFLEIQKRWIAEPPPKPEDLPKEKPGKGWLDRVGEQETQQEEDKKAAEGKAYLNKALEEIKLGLDAESVARLEAFAQSMAKATFGKDPVNAPLVYGKIFYGLFLRELQRNQSLASDEQFKVNLALSANERSLNGDLSRFRSADRGVDGSLFNTYLLGTTLLALPLPSQNAVLRMDDLIANASTPASMPYSPVEGGRESDRAGAGRSVLIQLAGYLKAPTAEAKEAQRKNLEYVLENYLNHVPSLQDHMSYNSVHTGSDALAPYYYYPSIPYAAAALRKLERDAKDPKVRAERREQRLELYGGLLDKLEKDGFQKLGQLGPIDKAKGLASDKDSPDRKRTYDSSPAYVNPLAGLALVAMVDECDGRAVAPSYGILDEVTEQAVPREKAPPPDNAVHPEDSAN